jgi:hypothetical protein
MNFAHPLAFLLLFLLIPVVLLYWLRVRVPREIVATGPFWQKALAEEKLRWSWPPWRPRISLPLEMLIVTLLAVAAAGPQIPASKRTILIIDNSATMRATDVRPTRLDAAKETARRLIEGLRPCDEMAVVTVCSSPSEIEPMTHERVQLAAAIDSVQATGEPAAIDWAVKLAREMAAPGEDRLKPELRAEVPARIVLVTDGCAKDATKRAEQTGVEVFRVGTAAGNVGITRFNARRSKVEPAKCEIFVELQNQGDRSAQGVLTLGVNSKAGASAPFSIAKDGRWQHIFECVLPAGGGISARIDPGDNYVFDDGASLEMPAARGEEIEGALHVRGEEIGFMRPMGHISHMGPIGPISPGTAGGIAEPVATDIRVPNEIGSDASALSIDKPRPPLWIVPSAMAAILLTIEWCLYQRRWTS